jgi:hypothetical protein
MLISIGPILAEQNEIGVSNALAADLETPRPPVHSKGNRA